MNKERFEQNLYDACIAWSDALESFRPVEGDPSRRHKIRPRCAVEELETPHLNLDTLEGELSDE